MSDPKPYNLDPAFEQGFVRVACSKPRVFGSYAKDLDPECLGAPEARLVARMAKLVLHETGSGPTSPAVVFQRARVLWEDGKVTVEEIQAAEAYVAAGSWAPTAAECRTALKPVLEAREKDEAIKSVLTNHAGKPDVRGALERACAAERIGEVDASTGVTLASGLERLAHEEDEDLLTTGIPELDVCLGGGLMRGTLGIFGGGAGDGKSFALCQAFAAGVASGVNAAFASLELAEKWVVRRVVGNLLDVKYKTIKNGTTVELGRRLAAMQPFWGRQHIQYFSPASTTVDDILSWVSRCEDEGGAPIDLLVVDYADKLISRSGSKMDRDDGTYMSMQRVYEGLRLWAQDNRRYAWSASQMKDRSGAKRYSIDHLSDSRHKGRVTDVVVLLQVDADGVNLTVAKDRHGEGHRETGILPVDFDYGRLVMGRGRR